MKRTLILVGLLLGLATGVARAQTRVGVYFAGRVVVGRPYYHRYARPYYHRYRIVVAEPRIVVVRPHRHNVRYHRGW